MGEDRWLVREVLEGRKGAMERFVREYQDVCWRVIYRLTGDREDTRELCQDAFLRAHKAMPSFRFDASLKTWMTRIAWSVAIRHLEKRRIPIDGSADVEHVAEHPDDAEDLASGLVREEMRGKVREALDTLPPMQRTLLTLYHFDEMPLADIARITSLPVGTIKSYLFRGRLALRERLLRHMEPTP